ncbi:MAG: hypothetical protein HRT47_01050 [Candidatus Caenarcaniphilales bacterium]|nr:hypothetical protein [Candidatus Caenarcaniphilales bacterium]
MEHLELDSCLSIIDIGSNSIRMVIYDEISSFPRIILDEKAECHLADGIGIDGLLKEENIEKALENINRFAALLDYAKIFNRNIIATSACREASNAAEFVASVEKILKTKVNIISGEREAKLSALGVSMEIPQASGLVADIGGGSLELSVLDNKTVSECTSFKLGYHSMYDVEIKNKYSERQMENYIDETLSSADFLSNDETTNLYLVGGRWKRLARLHMELNSYPLKIVGNYKISSSEVNKFLKIDDVNSTLRLAALLLKSLIKVTNVKNIIFCTNGIREGWICSKLKASDREINPLYESVVKITMLDKKIAFKRANNLTDWILSSGFVNLASGLHIDVKKIIFVSALLIQAFIFNNKEQKSNAVFNYVINLNLPNLSHKERIFMAYVLFCSLAGNKTNKEIKKYLNILDFPMIKKAKKLGYFFRLAIYLSPGDSKLLKFIDLDLENSGLKLSSSKKKLENLFIGSTIHEILLGLENLIGY